MLTAVTSHSLTLSAPASLSTSIFSLQYHETILKKNWTTHHLSSFWAEKVNMAHSGVLNYINVVLGQRHFNYNQVTPQLTFENQNVQDCVRNRAKYMGLGNNDCVVNNCKHMILFLTRSGQILIWFSWISSHRRPMYSIG